MHRIKAGAIILWAGMAMILGLVQGQSSEISSVDPRAWTELDIVPMPKAIRLTDHDLALDPALVVLVTGTAPSEHARFGAEWINRRLAAFGASPLRIADTAAAPGDATLLAIGTPDDHPWIAEGVQAGRIDVGPGNPGPRGYEIRASQDGMRIYLAGADPLGALYACVTFGELLEQRGREMFWRAAEVRDGPDFQHVVLRGSGFPVGFLRRREEYTPAMREAALGEMRVLYEQMLRRKESLVLWGFGKRDLLDMRRADPYRKETIRLATDLGKAHGIGAFYFSFWPYPGLKEDYPDLDPRYHMQEDGSLAQSDGDYALWHRGWSPDWMIRATAAELAGYIRELGLTDLGFHDTDTGGFDSPAQWAWRSPADHERWGDDFAAASINRHCIYYEEIKKAVPDANVHFTLYPYNISFLHETPEDVTGWPAQRLEARGGGDPERMRAVLEHWRERYTDFYSRVHAAFPVEDVTITTRENPPWLLDRLRALAPGRGFSFWFGDKMPVLYMNIPIVDFYRNERDVFMMMRMVWANDGTQIVPLQQYAAREFTWNEQAPGSGIRMGRGAGAQALDTGTEAYTILLPRLARNVFGRARAADIVAAITENVPASWIYYQPLLYARTAPARNWNIDGERHTEHRDYAGNRERLLDVLAGAERAAAALDRAWARRDDPAGEPGTDPVTLYRLTYLREYFHSCRWVAAIRCAAEEALILAAEGKEPEARAALAVAQEAHRQARAALLELSRQQPEGVSFDRRWFGTARHAFDLLSAGLGDEVAPLANVADMLAAQLAKAGADPIPEGILAVLSARRTVPVLAVRDVDWDSNNAAGAPRLPSPEPEHAAGAPRLPSPEPEHAAGAPHRYCSDTFPEGSPWKEAYPVETFLRLRAAVPALARTRARFLYDPEHLYVGIEARTIGGAAVHPEDRIELFLQPEGGARAPYAHFFFTADGAVRQRWNRWSAADVGGAWQQDNDWTCAGMESSARHKKAAWHVVARIPFSSLSDGWRPGPGAVLRLNIGRSYPLAHGQGWEHSSIQPAESTRFATLRDFAQARWTDQPFTPEVALRFVDPEAAVRTLQDAVATVVSFGIAVESNVELDDVTVRAEALDAGGHPVAQAAIFEATQVLYRWRPETTAEISFDEAVARGRVRLILHSRQATAEAEYAIGP